MVDWELMGLAEDDQFVSDEARADRDWFRYQLQWSVPASLVGALFVWWLVRTVAGAAWSAATSLARRWFQRAPTATRAQAEVGTVPSACAADARVDIARGTSVDDAVIRTT